MIYDVFYTGPRGALTSDFDRHTASLPVVGRDARNGSLAREATQGTCLLAVRGQWVEVTEEEWDAAFAAAKAKREAVAARR